MKSQLRRDVMAARIDRPLDATSSSTLVTLITQGLDGLDGYFSKYLPQLLLAVTVPLIVGVAILSADLTSAIILALTLPLIPVFMALVGWTTEAVTKRRWAVQTRLANHFADLIAGLPTLQVFGRAKAQAKGLLASEARHRSETMATLRVSFLSALVLELLATLSVALIAVTIGFRVVFGDLDLATALFVLILAPEVYLPVRQVGVHYHDAADGLAAVEQAFAVIDPPAAHDHADGPTLRQVVHVAPAAAGAMSTSGRNVGDGGPLAGRPRASPTPIRGRTGLRSHPPRSRCAPGEIVALTGPSGVGKTTLLNAVMGFLAPTGGQVTSRGEPIGRLPHWRDHLAYVGQEPGLLSGHGRRQRQDGLPARHGRGRRRRAAPRRRHRPARRPAGRRRRRRRVGR